MSNKIQEYSRDCFYNNWWFPALEFMLGHVKEENRKTFIKGFIDSQRPYVLEVMGSEFTENIYNNLDPLIQDTIYRITRVLDEIIIESIMGKHENSPFTIRKTIQAWLYVYSTKMKYPGLPIKSNKGESTLKKLSSQPITLGLERVCWSEENWKRLLKTATKLIKKNEKLAQETKFILDNIRYKEVIARLKTDKGMDYLENKQKQYKRKLRKLIQPDLEKIQDSKKKDIAEKEYRELLKVNVTNKFEELKSELNLING